MARFIFNVSAVRIRTGEAAGSKYYPKANGRAPVCESKWDNIGEAIRSSHFTKVSCDRSTTPTHWFLIDFTVFFSVKFFLISGVIMIQFRV